MDWATFTEFGLDVATVDDETVAVRATWMSQTAETRVPQSVLSAASSGTELFAEVVDGSVGELWRTALSAVPVSGGRVDVRLGVSGPGLAGLPWELLYDRTADLYLAASERTTLVRIVPLPSGRGPLALNGPLRVLTVGATDTVDAALLTFEAMGRLSRVRLTPVTLASLREHLAHHAVHVIHLGGVDIDVRPLVTTHLPLRLVVLDGADLPPADLVQAGSPAVVTIPAAMSDAAATPFVASLYRGLCGFEPLDLVVSRARTEVLRAHHHEPALPALWMSHPRTALVVGSEPAPPAASQRPPSSIPPPASPQPYPPAPRSGRVGSLWRSVREAAADLFSRSREAASVPPHPGTGPEPSSVRSAYPRIDIQARRTGRRDVVLVEEPFDVVVGLGRFHDVALAQTGAVRVSATGRTDLELVLTFDPTSLVAHGATRLAIAVTDAEPFPSQPVAFTALYRPDLPGIRRIGVHYLRDGQVVGIAWRSFVVVLDKADIAEAPVPPAEPSPMLDLEPLVGSDLPDLVLSVCASDGPTTGEFVWTAYARSTTVVVPDGPRISKLDNDVQQFVAGMRDAVAFSTDRYAQYLALVGKATRLGRAIPESIVSVIRGIVEDPTRSEAATVLLLTEEIGLPWELAVFDPPLDSVWGGVSPFLGAHAAVSRWPLTSRRPRPSPRSRVTVRLAAVLAADYAGVVGVDRLDHAQAEARQVAALFAPPAVTVPPSLRDVVGMLRGVPPADVLHVALHGRFDATGSDDGLVLVSTDTDGSPVRRALFLTPDQVETGRLDGGPFVFLNACQVASDKRVLADYAGFASTLLRIGATGVVAPLWNVDDDVAATFAHDFYAATWSAAGDSATVAEAVRAQRARYTEAAAESHTPGITPTLIAFQVFGHPRLRLTMSDHPPKEHDG